MLVSCGFFYPFAVLKATIKAKIKQYLKTAGQGLHFFDVFFTKPLLKDRIGLVYKKGALSFKSPVSSFKF